MTVIFRKLYIQICWLLKPGPKVRKLFTFSTTEIEISVAYKKQDYQKVDILALKAYMLYCAKVLYIY